MSDVPREPVAPPGMRPHKDRVADVDRILTEGKTGSICIDNEPNYIAWYKHELTKYPRLQVVMEGVLATGIYVIKVRKGPSLN